MKKKLIGRKMKWAILSCCLALFVCSTLYFSGISININDGKIQSLSFISRNSHTGLAEPVFQIAINDRDRAASQFAANSSNQILNTTPKDEQTVALNNTPRVLFDISVQPIFEKNNAVAISLWLTAFLLFLLIPFGIIYRAYRKAKIKKIKGNYKY